ncbi:MAG TPA: hypothetical protein VFN78_11700 [Ktedonobacterales bacterium]|nr:hypothetical protein [Ktedonobacterales bacterium]
MTPDTLTCADNVAPERLSALRDVALTSADAERLREHITTCAACQARLADYDVMATTLRQQRELEPGERIINGVRARLAIETTSRRRSRPSRRFWASVATLAPVAAIILLFVYVFSGLAARIHPTGSGTPTVSAPTATNPTGKPNSPTATPQLVQLPSFTPSVSTDAAWGSLSPVATDQTPTVANTAFSFDALSQDGTILIGTETTNMNPGSGHQDVYLISYDIASHTYRRLGPHWAGYIGPWGGADAVSARYIAYGFNSAPGATCGICKNTLWGYDRQTGASWEFDPGTQSGVQYGGVQQSFTSSDHVAFQTMSQQVWVADLAARTVTVALPPGAKPISATSSAPQPGIRLLGFTWPNIIYTYSPVQTNPNTPIATTLRITNLQTRTTTIMPTPLDSLLGVQNSGANINWASMSGDTLYFTTYTGVNGVDAMGAPISTGYGMLFHLSLAPSSSGQPEMLARWEEPNAGQGAALGPTFTPYGANDRLIILAGGDVWDIAAGRLVRLPSSGANQTPAAALAGNYLAVAQTVTSSDPNTSGAAVTIYNTSALPVR